MSKSQRGAEFWAAVVAEVKKGDLSRVQVAAKHGVSDAALKYHLYKTVPTKTRKSSPELLPVRLSGSAPKQVEFEFSGGLRLRFDEGSDPAYVAAIVSRLR
jgi:transposase-like protein